MIEDDEAIVSLEAWRLSKRRLGEGCTHERSVIDERAGTVECRDCGAYLSAFHVLLKVAREENTWATRVRAMRAEVAELKAWSPFLKTVKLLERMWRGKRSLPCCPHCGRGLWAEELCGPSHGARYEIGLRKAANIAIPAGVDRRGGLEILGGDA